MSYIDRKKIELKRKVLSLTDEFGNWREVSEKGQPLEKHHTQIRRITNEIGAAHELLLKSIEEAAEADNLLDKSIEFEEQILECHRIWNFFRDKFALRHMAWFKPFLSAADELAWSCYKPACKKAIDSGLVETADVKEPPLAFFSDNSSAYTVSRNTKYGSEITKGGQRIQIFASLVKALPIPVIGLPWFQLAHLPDAVVICHEVGHNVEDDLGLREAIEARLEVCLLQADVPTKRKEVWHKWRGEIFADIYGTLAAGPAYVGAQADFLTAAADDIMNEDPLDNLDLYPSTYLRMLIVFEVLEQMKYGNEAKRRRDEWRSLYPKHALPTFEKDVPVVVKAIIEGDFLGGVPLREVLFFSKENYEDAQKDADRVLDGFGVLGTDVRSLMATARLSFEKDPQTFLSKNVQQIILEKIQKTIASGTRSNERLIEYTKGIEESDRAKGALLMQHISALTTK